MLIISCGSAELRGFCLPVMKIPVWKKKRLLEYCKNNELKTLIAPTISEADSDGNFHQWVRPIKIEDLLGSCRN